ncbi:MAG: Nif3-like dinuclear metal center hexameric protein [Tannerellaceae bacterium]|jgi:dinuclear metal center YbgI/SA1388 family protein|nr:Nif3-like dinuclear metal center hexameric protein [Tannerellaceae bacterium]
MDIKIKDILEEIERHAPLSLQEGYDNSGVQAGDVNREATAALLCLDVTEAVIDEALVRGCNLIISHHPLVFKPIKSLSGKTYIERCLIKACKHDITVYCAHTNLDNAPRGVNYHLGMMLGLENMSALGEHSDLTAQGIVGELPSSEEAMSFLKRIKEILHAPCIRHSAYSGDIRKVALCGGSGAFLIPQAIASKADVFITGEARYNDFYDVEDKILLAVAGHYESEICTKGVFHSIISKKFPTFVLHLSDADSNPVKYL